MAHITPSDVEHIAELARIELTPDEIAHFTDDIAHILAYVVEINKITGDTEGEKQVGARYNVMRDDEESHEPGVYTEDLLNEAPIRRGAYIEVQKILGQ